MHVVDGNLLFDLKFVYVYSTGTCYYNYRSIIYDNSYISMH